MFRCEWKYVLDADGRYRVSSLYFDDYCDSCLQDNLSGVFSRRKSRIRACNGSDALIRLERKIRRDGGCLKEDVPLTREQYEGILGGDPPAVLPSPGIQIGQTYTVYYGGECTGTLTDGVYAGGTVTGGEELTAFTVSGVSTALGRGGGRPGGGGPRR